VSGPGTESPRQRDARFEVVIRADILRKQLLLVMQEIYIVGARANVIRLQMTGAIDFDFIITTSAARSHLDVERLGIAASTSDNAMRRVGVESRPGTRSAGLGVNDFINGQCPVAIDYVGIPVQPGEIAGQRAGLAAVAVAILLIGPPGVVNCCNL